MSLLQSIHQPELHHDISFSVENTKREDIAFIAFQIWLLGMSLVALLNESIPHV